MCVCVCVCVCVCEGGGGGRKESKAERRQISKLLVVLFVEASFNALLKAWED